LDESKKTSSDINEVLEGTINIVWNELKYKATLKKELGNVPPIFCNPQQLSQVFMNLLVNASHAIENQGEIALMTWSDNDFMYVTVSDNGCGIPEEIQRKIFEPFFTTKEIGKGTGLGLSISYEIIKKHGGDLTVESAVGKGTTFTVKLPLAEMPEEIELPAAYRSEL
jgi:two-component system NtrC family sensor kinase